VIRPFVQGASRTRRTALRFPVVLVAAHVGAAGLVVAVLYQIGTAFTGLLPRSAAVVICGAAAMTAIAIDVRAVRRNTYSVGLQRQTSKVLAHDPDRPWWVTPLFWGLDTGLIWSTFRVSCTSWVLLLAALLNLVPQWGGVVYGLSFGLPLLVAVSTGDPDTFAAPGGRKLRLAQVAGVVVLAVLPLDVILHGYLAV
jgi:hypothetical protein